MVEQLGARQLARNDIPESLCIFYSKERLSPYQALQEVGLLIGGMHE